MGKKKNATWSPASSHARSPVDPIGTKYSPKSENKERAESLCFIVEIPSWPRCFGRNVMSLVSNSAKKFSSPTKNYYFLLYVSLASPAIGSSCCVYLLVITLFSEN